MRTLNDLICTTPFSFTGVQQETRASGLKQVANFVALAPLKVMVDGPDGIRAGDTVWVRGNECKSGYAKDQHKLPTGEVCIFVPKSSVVMCGYVVNAPEPQQRTTFGPVMPLFPPDMR